MLNLEVLESALAVLGVVMLRFVLFLGVVFVMAIPIAIVVHAAQLVRRLVHPATAAVIEHGEGAAKVPR